MDKELPTASKMHKPQCPHCSQGTRNLVDKDWGLYACACGALLDSEGVDYEFDDLSEDLKFLRSLLPIPLRRVLDFRRKPAPAPLRELNP